MLKKIIIPLFSLLTIFGAQSQQRVILDKVVAVVGNSSILHSEVKVSADELTQQRRQMGYTSDVDPMVEALESIMEVRLLANQARIDSVEINLVAINSMTSSYIDQMISEAGGIAQLEKEQGLKLFIIRENIHSQYEEQSLYQNMQYEIISKVKIVPGEVEAFYKSMDKEDIPLIGDQYVYAQITRFPSSIEEAKRRVKERLLDMRERVVTGQTKFSVLAQMYSADPSSAYRGGEMDPQPSSGFVTEFAEALEGLRVGQVSEIVETEFGFHIIELIDKQGDMYHCRHILLRPSFTNDELLEPVRFLDSIATEIRRDSLTMDAAAMLYSDDASSKMNGGLVSNYDLLERTSRNDPKLTVTKFLKEDFGSRGYKSINDFTALSKLKEGEISPAFLSEDMLGNQLAKFVKLLEVIPSHAASLEQDYLQLEALALEDKKMKVYNDWLVKHIKTMYVYISPEFRDGEFRNKEWVK
ncbi:MAG: peptidylprolyl isomerase [Rikenellaceae bacterium]